MGLTPWRLGADISARDLGRQAELAEQWGYHSFWLPESHFAGAGSIPDPLLWLAAVAGRTSSIRLGTTSYLLPIRHPLQAAEQVAALDQLSEGRLILGLGRGYRAGMLAAFGVKAGEKRQIFEQTLATMRAAWAAQPLGAAATASVLAPLPRQRPHPPLWVAAFGPKALDQAARLGLPYLASPMETLQELATNLGVYHQALAQYGFGPPEEVPVMRTIFIHEDETVCQQIRQQLLAVAAMQASTDPEHIAQTCLIGSLESVNLQLTRYRDQLQMNYLIAVQPRIKGLNTEWQENSLRQLITLADAEPVVQRRIRR